MLLSYSDVNTYFVKIVYQSGKFITYNLCSAYIIINLCALTKRI